MTTPLDEFHARNRAAIRGEKTGPSPAAVAAMEDLRDDWRYAQEIEDGQP